MNAAEVVTGSNSVSCDLYIPTQKALFVYKLKFSALIRYYFDNIWQFLWYIGEGFNHLLENQHILKEKDRNQIYTN